MPCKSALQVLHLVTKGQPEGLASLFASEDARMAKLIRTGMEDAAKVYDDLAPVYDSTFLRKLDEAENQTVMTWLGNLPGNILDVGCGTGLYLDYHKAWGTIRDRYRGLDISHGMISEAARKYPQFDWGLADMVDMEQVPSGWANHVISLFGSLSYCMFARAAVAEMWRCLAPGGSIHVMALGPRYEHRKTHISAGRCPFTVYWPRDLYSIFESVGFTDVRIDGLTWATEALPNSLPQSLFTGLVDLERRTICRLAPTLGYMQMVSARKPARSSGPFTIGAFHA